MAHRNARLTPYSRRLLVERVLSGQPVSHVAKALGVSRRARIGGSNAAACAGGDDDTVAELPTTEPAQTTTPTTESVAVTDTEPTGDFAEVSL